MPNEKPAALTRYEVFVIALLALLQFTVVLDFALLSPLGAFLMPELSISPAQFSHAVSVYAFAACGAGILSAGFADRFDRKRILIVFYIGFLIGTLLCGLATSYHFLLAARLVAGFFGGVIASIVNAIVADLFPMSIRGRVMGSIQTAFSAAQVMGIPVGLYLANRAGWHGPFLALAAIGVLIGTVVVLGLNPIRGHLVGERERNPLQHLLRTATTPRYLVGFSAVMLTATGAFMIQPFASNYSVHNLGVSLEKLPMVYMAAGIFGIIGGPLLGRLSDSVGKLKMFLVASAIGAVYLIWYTRLGVPAPFPPLWLVVAANAFFALVIVSRSATSMAMISAVPVPKDRGAYMAVSASAQQLAGGISAWLAGLIVIQPNPDTALERYPMLGIAVAGAMIVTAVMMTRLYRKVIAPGIATSSPAA